MKSLIVLPDRSPLIGSDDWNTFVALKNDILLAEKILARMKAEYTRREREILQKLDEGGSIENSGRIAS